MTYLHHRRGRSLAWGLTLALLAGCGSSDKPLPSASIADPSAGQQVETSLKGLADPEALVANPPAEPPPRENLYPRVVIKTNVGNVELQLNAEKSPETVDNFLENYVARSFYEGTIFHYVEPGFLVAAGGFDQELNAREARAPIRNESQNGLKNLRGTVAMSRDADYADSATSQFFINLDENTSLDNPAGADGSDGYCVFGKVVDGMDVVDRIAQQPVADRGEFPSVPVQPVIIQSVQRVE